MKNEESWNERKRLLVRAHPPPFHLPSPFKALKQVAARKMFFAEKEMEKGGSFGRDTVYMQILNTRVVSTANFRISTSHGVCVRALSRISFSDFSSCDVGGNVDDEKKERKEERKKERKEKKAIVSFLWSVCKSGMEKSCISDERSWSDISCPLLKLGRDSDLGFDENRKTRWQYGYREAFFFFVLAFSSISFRGIGDILLGIKLELRWDVGGFVIWVFLLRIEDCRGKNGKILFASSFSFCFIEYLKKGCLVCHG